MRPDNHDSAFLWDMRKCALEIQEYTAGMSKDAYEANGVVKRAVERLLEIIGEAARSVSSEFQSVHPEVPWRQIVAQRNVIAHNYGDILPERIYSVVMNRIPELIACLDKIIPKDA